MRRPATVLACLLALAVIGCGGSDETSATGADSAAGIAPANAAAYVAVDSDLDSDQWQQAQELLDRFPGKDRLLAELREELGEEDIDWERDVDPALGPETAIVVLDGENDVVGLTKPDDREKLDALLKRVNEEEDENYVLREIEGWTAIADTDAILDAFERGADAGTLDDDERFQDALAELPEQALAKAYISGDAIDETAEETTGSSTDVLTGGAKVVSVALALEALDEGAKLSGATQLEGGDPPGAYEATLLERVPDDALAVFSFNDLATGIEQAQSAEGVAPALSQVEQLLGVDVDDLKRLVAGESIVYVRAGTPIPEVTVLLDVEDTAAAQSTVDRLAERAASSLGARTGTTEVDGEQVKYVDIQGIRISYTTFDGLLALTSGPTGIRDARSDDDKISGDERFQAAKEAAGMGDESNGFLYVDLKDSIPLVEGVAGLADEEIPTEVSENLAPLESFLAYAEQDGEILRFGGILAIAE